MSAMTWTQVGKRARGRLVVVGWDIDRVMGIFSTVKKALKALEKAKERDEHSWWMEFRKLNADDRPSIFQRLFWHPDKAKKAK